MICLVLKAFFMISVAEVKYILSVDRLCDKSIFHHDDVHPP